MTAGEVEHSQSGSNSYDGHGSTTYPMRASAGDKVRWLRSALSPESSFEMQAAALNGLELESVGRLNRIVELYGGGELFCGDVYASTELVKSRRFIKLHTFFASVLEPEHLDAISINALLKKYSLGRATLLICYRTDSQIEQIKERYHAIFGEQLEVDIGKFTASYHKNLLESISIQSARHGDDDVVMVDREEVDRTVISLYENIRESPGSALEIIMYTLVGKSREFINAVFDAYVTKYGRSLETDLTSAQDDVLFGYELPTIMTCSVNRPKYFAQELHTAKIQNDHEKIVWAITTMAKRSDMERIKAEYSDRYGRTLEGDVSVAFFDRQDYLELILLLLNYNVPN